MLSKMRGIQMGGGWGNKGGAAPGAVPGSLRMKASGFAISLAGSVYTEMHRSAAK